jgi:hypothetical protein
LLASRRNSVRPGRNSHRIGDGNADERLKLSVLAWPCDLAPPNIERAAGIA